MPDAPISPARRVYRAVGMVLALGFGAGGLVLIVLVGSQRAMSIGIVLALWGIAVGYVATMEPRRHHGSAGRRETESSASNDHAGVALIDEDRERYELQLEAMLRREIERVLRAELAELRGEVAVLRGELNEKFDGQLRLERIETTRVVGSDIQSLHEEVRRLSAARDQDSVVPLLAQGVDFGPPRRLNGDHVGSPSAAAATPEHPSTALDLTQTFAPVRDTAGEPTPVPDRDAVRPPERAVERHTYAPPAALTPTESVPSPYSPPAPTPVPLVPPVPPAFGSGRSAAGANGEAASSTPESLQPPAPPAAPEPKAYEPPVAPEPKPYEVNAPGDDPFAAMPRLGAFVSPDLLLDTDPPVSYRRPPPPPQGDPGPGGNPTGRRRRAEGEENEVLNRIIGHS